MPRRATYVLAVAFRPFGGRRRNESESALRAARLPGPVRTRVRSLVLPVTWRGGLARLARELGRAHVGAVVLTGEAGGRAVPTPERWGRNRARALRDEGGRLPAGVRLAPAGPSRRLATWPARDVVRVLRAAGVPARESRDAGGFLCNAALYAALGHPAVRRRRLPVTFLHLPVPGAGARRDVTPARLATAVRAVLVEAVRRLDLERPRPVGPSRGRAGLSPRRPRQGRRRAASRRGPPPPRPRS